MKMPERKNLLLPLIGIAWIVAIFASYYAFNTDYYAEKFATFGPYLLKYLD